ncbi:MAG TPA: iron-sulfur-binding ferredoxin reductase [Pseudomonas sp.]|uniref:iron-sulfur-binding ferredoxin reductase n=1 Tax=Pseudomonas sp. TaxID=306 RepID=UPI002CCA701A|nr:iron-sulfur-binding ferredoxin reductase [Pseudomonas sp.]HSX89568.1 iron-sulfur-binding ferredoxin reductase [Pseudomonas sp.]
MPELQVGERRLPIEPGRNLLDALHEAGVAIPYSCRAGSCHACLVRCIRGEPQDDKPEALAAARREQGWRLACQCRLVEDLQVEVFDPLKDGLPALIHSCDWLSPDVLRLRLLPEQPLRYRAGQHLVLWTQSGVARPYSLASLPGEDPWLEFHLDCRQPGAFSDAARHFVRGQPLRLGELRGGALHYDLDWQNRPLWLLAAGTGIAPLYAVLREALREEHRGEIRVLHLARDSAEHYLAAELRQLAAAHSQVRVELLCAAELPAALAQLKLVSRQTLALLCGSPNNVESFTRRLYLAGMPRNQMFSDLFLPHA